MPEPVALSCKTIWLIGIFCLFAAACSLANFYASMRSLNAEHDYRDRIGQVPVVFTADKSLASEVKELKARIATAEALADKRAKATQEFMFRVIHDLEKMSVK